MQRPNLAPPELPLPASSPAGVGPEPTGPPPTPASALSAAPSSRRVSVPPIPSGCRAGWARPGRLKHLSHHRHVRDVTPSQPRPSGPPLGAIHPSAGSPGSPQTGPAVLVGLLLLQPGAAGPKTMSGANGRDAPATSGANLSAKRPARALCVAWQCHTRKAPMKRVGRSGKGRNCRPSFFPQRCQPRYNALNQSDHDPSRDFMPLSAPRPLR